MAAPIVDAPSAMPTGELIVGYYPAWATYERDYQVSEIPAARLTHVNYAFANIQAGGCALGDAWADVQKTFQGDTWDESSANGAGNFKQLRALRDAQPALRTLISVGGWTWSSQFSDAALSDASRSKFASSCVDFMVEHGFDGLDIDWEYPIGGGFDGNVARPEDKQNYTALLQAIRARMTAKQRELARAEPYLLTIAAPAGPALLSHLDSRSIASVVDWINVMAYDFHGSWESETGHNAPLIAGASDRATGFNVAAAIDGYLSAGVPSAKLVMGVPFYGRSFAGVSAGASHGLYQSSTGAGPGTWENGVLDYHDLVAHYIGAAGFTRYDDAQAQVPYLFDPQRGVFISYDDPTSLAAKARHARNKALRGTMIWDLSSDTADHALLTALAAP
jgi:chitinase